MDGSAASDEELEDGPSQDERSSQSSSTVPGKDPGGGGERLLGGTFSPSVCAAAAQIVEGKRAKKTVERLDFQAPKQKEKLKIGDGKSEIHYLSLGSFL